MSDWNCSLSCVTSRVRRWLSRTTGLCLPRSLRPGCRFQESTCPPVELDDFQLLVDHDAGGYVAVYQQALYLLLHSEHRFGKIRRARLFGFPLRVIEPREVGDQPRRRLLLLIDLVL